jgi:hypothetical protein
MATLLAFLPQAVSSAAEENHFASATGFLECLGIHEAEHQYFARTCVLDDDWQQATAFVESQFHMTPKIKKPAGTFAPAG